MNGDRIAEPYWRIMESELFRVDGGQIDLPVSLIELAAAVKACKGDTDWNLGEGHSASLAELLIGAYWALSEWHGGQSSLEYAALSAIGGIYCPGLTDGPEPESGETQAYEACCEWFSARQRKIALAADYIGDAAAAAYFRGVRG